MRTILERLLEVSVYASVLTAAILAFQGLFRKRISARLNYLCWMLLVLRLCLPVTLDSGVHITLPVLEALPAISQEQVPASHTATDRGTVPPQDAAPSLPEPWQQAAPQPDAARQAVDWYVLAGGLWLGGAIVSLGALLWLQMRLHRRINAHSLGVSAQSIKLLEECRKQAGVKRARLVVTDDTLSAAAVFYRGAPTVIVPKRLEQQPASLRFVMLHELMHLKTADPAMLLLCGMLRCVYWFHPLLHLALSRMQADMESACDARVLALAVGKDKEEYLRVLLSQFSKGRQLAPGMAEYRTKRLARRRIEDAFRKKRTGGIMRFATTCLCLMLCVCCFTTACQAGPKEPEGGDVRLEPSGEARQQESTGEQDGSSQQESLQDVQRRRNADFAAQSWLRENGKQEDTGDWDGDGLEDRAYMVKNIPDPNEPDYFYNEAVVVEFSDGQRVEANSIQLYGMSGWGGGFYLEGSDLTGDGRDELLLFMDLGGNGGDGSFVLYVYERKNGEWTMLDSPAAGWNFTLSWKAGILDVACPDTGYQETVADRDMVLAHYKLQGQQEYWQELEAQDYFNPGASDALSNFAIVQREGRNLLLLRQYITGPTGVHVDCFGYGMTLVGYSLEGEMEVQETYFVLDPQMFAETDKH